MSVIELNDLLSKAGVYPKHVMVMRHRPTEKALRDVLPWLAADQPDIYNAYQSNHGEIVETALAKATHLASFIGHQPGRAVFVGLYRMAGFRQLSVEEFWALPTNQMLQALGTRGPKDGRDSLWFDLQPSELIHALKGRLVIEWTGIERSWWRWSSRNALPVHAIHEESLLVQALPEWHSISLTWQELQLLPSSWKQALAQWRGVYYIFDRQANKGYVGSAYGSDNLIGRWLNYAASGHGGNKLLRARDPSAFVFSILQRVSPDLDPDGVIAVENSWKDRLHSRSPFGLNEN